ncbi:hypothetical protein ACAG39_09315 [Caldicellulosiruptoraceae bacterium PP1]
MQFGLSIIAGIGITIFVLIIIVLSILSIFVKGIFAIFSSMIFIAFFILLVPVLIFLIFLFIYSSKPTYKKLYEDDTLIAKHSQKTMCIGRFQKSPTFKFSKFYGIETLYTIEAKETSKIKIEYTFEVAKGKLKLVVVLPDKSVVNIIEGSAKGYKDIFIPQGKSDIRIVAFDATGEIDVKINESQEGEKAEITKY